MTTIQISERLRDKLKEMGKKGDSYEDVIWGLVEYKERENKEGRT
jgi:predicted CopG family antitoxin